MEGDTPLKQKFLNTVMAMDDSSAYAASHLIFECCHDYQQDFGTIDSDMVRAVAHKLELDEQSTRLCVYCPELFYILQQVRQAGHSHGLRARLSEPDRIGYDAYLVLNQMRRLGGTVTASQLQRVMSGCHHVSANQLKLSLGLLCKVQLIVSYQESTGQWWNPRQMYRLHRFENDPGTVWEQGPSDLKEYRPTCAQPI